jgi:hypothetical protein
MDASGAAPGSAGRPPVPGPAGPTAILTAAGLVCLALGIVLAIAYWVGEVRSSLFPTGWLFPAVLIATGALMAARRRPDLVMALWGGLALAVFMLDVLVYMRALDLGVDDPAAFDATIIVAAFGLLALVLRPLFRR